MAYAMSQWHYLEQHPAAAPEMPDVNKIAEEVWNEINSLCTLNPVRIVARYDYEKFNNPKYAFVLATASRTMFLIDNKLQSGALNKYGLAGEILIDVNPYVPNGWNVDTGNCDVGNHYDLRTVLRHEILHGIGISSSVTPDGVGYTFGEFCYPYAFDTVLQTSSGKSVVSGCHLLTEIHSDIYVSGMKLYNPANFRIGSSLSHTNRQGILYYGLPSRQCLPFDDASLSMLNALGGNCMLSSPVGITSAAGETSLWGIYIVLILCIKWTLRI